MPTLVMAQPVKLATPETVATVRPPVLVQLSTPNEGLLPMARVTFLVSVSTVLPLVSWTATDTLKEPVPVAWMFWFGVGWVVKVKLVAVPAVMLKALALVGAVWAGVEVAVSV